MEKKSSTFKAAIIATSIYFILISVLILLAAWWGYKNGIEGATQDEIKGTIIFFFIPLSLLPLVPAIGILLLKNWARRLIIILSVAGVFLGICMSLPSLVYVFSGQFNSIQFPLLLLICGIIPAIFFLVYFNKQPVKDQFKQKLLMTSAFYTQSSEEEIHNKIGTDYVIKGQLDKAISEFTKSVQINPDFAKGYANRGLVYARQGKYDQSLSDFGKAIEADPSFIPAYENRALVYFEIKKYDKSWDDVHKVETLGGKINDVEFLKQLKQSSGREK